MMSKRQVSIDIMFLDILSKADIDKYIRQNKRETPTNEYKMVKSIEMDETECLTSSNDNIEQLHKEISLHIEEDVNTTGQNENIDDLKSSLFDNEEI
jgi:hypothetical protein